MTIRSGSSRYPAMVPLEAADRPADQATRKERLRALFEQEFDYVWASLRRLGVHARELEDVAQEVLVQLYRRLDDYDPARPIRPWLFGCATRCASDWRRLARHRVEVLGTDDDEAAHGAPGADELLGRARDHALVLRALAEIDPDRRAVFILHELDECQSPT